MVTVGGLPVLEHLVNYLRQFHLQTIIVNTHHKPLHIMKYFGNYLLYTYEPKLLGEKETIRQLIDRHPFIRLESLVVINGDTLTNLDLQKMYRLSMGKSVRAMDKGVYTGQMILTPEYMSGVNTKIVNYYDSEQEWVDMGSFSGLKKAREKFI